MQFSKVNKQRSTAPVVGTIEMMTALAEENGKLKALHYVSGWIDYHLAKENVNAAYIAAMVDLKVNVESAIQRTCKGEPMQSMSEFVDAE